MNAFLTAEWKNLMIATYEVDKRFLMEFLPCKTELNDWNGKYFLSIVGFLFIQPAVMGIRMPFYTHFPEINLRFYARHKDQNQWKPGVVFIREISPSRMIGVTAKWLYHENFITLPMRHEHHSGQTETLTSYSLKVKNKWSRLELITGTIPLSRNNTDGSIESFVCDQYTGYTKLDSSKTIIFHVRHRPWKVHPALQFKSNIEPSVFNIKGLSEVLTQQPAATFLMDGSYTEVSKPRVL